MSSRRKVKSLFIIVMVAVLLLALVGFVVYKRFAKPSNSSSTPNSNTIDNQSQGGSKSSGSSEGSKTVSNDDFTFNAPTGWAFLAKASLDSTGATSGISRISAPGASFTIKVADAKPTSDNDLKNSTINELKKAPGFSLLSNANTQVSGKSGQKFVYTISGQSNSKLKQEMSVVVNKQKTFFLLFSAYEPDFDKLGSEYKQILDNFKFN
jgi:hypothetical protein